LVLAAVGAVRLALIARRGRSTPRGVALSDLPMIGGAVFVLANLPRALIPVLEHDENVYHLLLPKLYLAGHALTPLPWSLGANMPHLVDLSFVFPIALGGFTAAKVFVLGFIGWTLVGLAPFGRELLGPIGPGVMAVLFLSGRIVQWHFGLSYVEPVIGALLLCGLQSLRRYWSEGERDDLMILAVLTGVACASKYTVWPHAVVSFALVAWAKRPDGRRIGFSTLALAAGIAALLVIPWLAKNALVTGNPIYPNAPGLLDGAHWSTTLNVQFQHEMGYGRAAETDVLRYVTLPYHLVADPYTGILGGASLSAGWMALLLASMAFPWRRREFATPVRVLAVAGYVFWCLGSKQTRYLVAFIPVMTVAAAMALAPLARFRRALPAATIALVAIALVQIRLQPYPAEPLLEAFSVSRAELLGRNYCWDLAQFLNTTVPPGGRVLSFWENRLYFLDRPFIADSSYGAPAVLGALRDAGDAHAFATAMAAEGVTHVVVNPYFYSTYKANGFLYNLVDDVYYPASQLKADTELFEKFVNEELTAVPWNGDWPVFHLNAAH
jgi:hypothetical protein